MSLIELVTWDNMSRLVIFHKTPHTTLIVLQSFEKLQLEYFKILKKLNSLKHRLQTDRALDKGR